jgi:hypothetical protein
VCSPEEVAGSQLASICSQTQLVGTVFIHCLQDKVRAVSQSSSELF